MPLKRFGRIVGGATPRASPELWDEGITWYTPTDVSRVHGRTLGRSMRTLSCAGVESCSISRIPPWSVVFTSRAPIGNVALTDRECTTNQGCKTLIPGPDVEPRFVLYCATVRTAAMRAAGVGTTFLEVSGDRLGTVRFPKPDGSLQRAISDFLDRECARIAAVLAASDQLNELALELLSSDIYEKLIRGPDQVPLGRLLTLQRGHDLPEGERSNSGYPVVGSGGIVGLHNQPVCPGPGVVTGRYGSVGAVHWIDGPHWPLNTTLYVRDSKGHDLRYLYWLLKGLPLASDAAKSAVPGLHRADAHRMTVARLSRDSQVKEFRSLDAIAARVDRFQVLAARLSLGLKQYRDALITEAVTGQLDVTKVSETQMDERLNAAAEGASTGTPASTDQ